MKKTQLKEKADAGLELISIGSLYSGPLDKKYWSSSRGKDQYPYPVGYQAVRAYTGIKYKMEIHESPKGPLFMITSMDGSSFSGQTPDIAWEMFQKKGCLNMKIWHGKRSSCKVDGVEFFGFKNPFVQRLLRELVANVSGAAELNLLPSNLCNKASGSVAEHLSDDKCENNDLLSCLERPEVTGKRSRRHGVQIKKPPIGANLKRIRTQGPKTDSKALKLPSSVSINEGNQSFPDASSEAMHVQEEDVLSESRKSFQVAHVSAEAMHVQEEDAVSENRKSFQVAHNLLINKKPPGRLLSMNQLEDIGHKRETDDDSVDAPFQKDCLNIGVILESAPVILEKDKLNQIDNLTASTIVSSEKLVTRPEEMCSLNMNSSPAKNYSDSVGQDMVKSMMTFLLPQAIPLLKKTSEKKKTLTSTSETLPCDGNSKDIFLMEKEDRERQENMHNQPMDVKSIVPSLDLAKSVVLDSLEDEQYYGNAKDILLMENDDRERQESMHTRLVDGKFIVPSSELAKSVVLDSLEDEQYCEHVNNNGSLLSTIADGRTSVKEDSKPVDSGQQASGNMNDESLVYHLETTGSKNPCNNEIGENLLEPCQDGNLRVSACLPSCISSGRVLFDETMPRNIHMEACSLKLPISPCKMDLKTTQDYMEHNCQEQACSSGSLAQLSQAQHTNDSSVRNTTTYLEPLKEEIIAKKEVAGNDIFPSSQIPRMVYSRRKTQNMPHLAREYNRSLNEAYTTSCLGEHFDAQTSLPTESLHVSSINPMNFLPDNQQREDSVSEPTLGEQSAGICTEKTAMISEAGLEIRGPCSPSLDQDEALLRAKNNEDNAGLLNKPWREPFEACVTSEMSEQNNLLRPNNYELSNKMETTFSDNCMDSYPHCNLEISREAEGISKIVGCYSHPLPVLSVFLSNIDNAIYICVLCGLPVDKKKTLFAYRVEVKESRVGYPSFFGYTTLILPVLKDYVGTEIAPEKSGFQWTPDGSYLVLIGSIRTPFCRTGSTDCLCSTCTSDKFEENVVKIVQVKYGYVSVIASLRSDDCLNCILACEPDHLVAVGKGGRLHLWVMDSTWSKEIESYTIPSEDCVSPNLVELKRIPKCADLVVGHNGLGEFSLWDISKRALMSRFCTSSTSVYQFFPISLFSWKRREKSISDFNSRDHVNELLDPTNTISKISGESLSTQMKDTAVWLFVSTESNSHVSNNYLPSDCQMNQVGMWKLALFANNMVTFGAELDLRASAIGVSTSQGIIGTHDGLVYVWDLSTGNKLGTLLCFSGASVSCIATDTTESGIVAVAADRRLLVYLLSSDGRR